MKVSVTKEKLDALANAVSSKSGESIPLTIDEMTDAVYGIETTSAPVLQDKTYNVDSEGTETITADSGYDGLGEVEVNVPSAEVLAVITGGEYRTINGNRWWYIMPSAACEANGWISYDSVIPAYAREYQAIAANTTVTPSESAQTIGGADYMMEGAVTVNAIPSNYVGSGITQRSSSDLTASGATVTVPSGYYSSQASKSVSSGTAGTPTASKGTVSNHSVSVTPSVTNTTGYITGGTKTGTAVSVSASELVSGTYTVSSSGTQDVTNYASISVASGTAGTPTASKGSVSNHSVSVTPSVTNTTGYITGSTKTGTAVTVSASELVSGSETKTANGTYDVTNLAELVVNVSGGGGASNFVTDTFTTGSGAGASSLTIPYTGSGYPIMAVVVVEGGAYNSAITGWYNSVQRYAVGQWTMTKSVMTSTPSYGTSGTQNQGVTTAIYKNSTSTSTTYTRTSAMNTNVFSSSNASNAAATCVRLKTGNVLSYYVNTSSYGLLPSTTYRYFIVYSS